MVKATSPVVRFIEEANSGLLLAEAGVQLSSVFHVEHFRLIGRNSKLPEECMHPGVLIVKD